MSNSCAEWPICSNRMTAGERVGLKAVKNTHFLARHQKPLISEINDKHTPSDYSVIKTA